MEVQFEFDKDFLYLFILDDSGFQIGFGRLDLEELKEALKDGD